MATTKPLPNGYAHTIDDLNGFCEQTQAQIRNGEIKINQYHRPDLDQKGRILRAWVAPMPEDPTLHGFFVEYESDSDMKYFSISFFGHGVSVGQSSEQDLVFGFPPGLVTNDEAYSFLHDISSLVGEKNLAFRNFYSHDLNSLAQGALMIIITAPIAGYLGKFGAMLAEKSITLLKNKGAGKVGRVQVTATTKNGKVYFFAPANIGGKLLESALKKAFQSIHEHHTKGKSSKRSIQTDDKGSVNITDS